MSNSSNSSETLSKGLKTIITLTSDGNLSDIRSFNKYSYRDQFIMCLIHFGYSVNEIAEGMSINIKEVEAVGINSKIKDDIHTQLKKWQLIKQQATEAITPDKLNNESVNTLIKVASLAEVHIQTLENKIERQSSGKLSAIELKDNALKLLGE